jgi:hypothetical protein
VIFVADARRDKGKRYIVRADEKSPAFVELESAICAGVNCLDKLARFSRNSTDMKTSIPSVLITFALVCFWLSPTAKALLPAPSPDGGYPGGNTAEGINALHDVNTAVGINNTAVGANALTHDTTGNYNVAVGEAALANNTTGNFNMAIGTEALTNNNANFNLAIGFRVGFMNTTGNHLTGIGAAALRNNTTGSFNTAIGSDALRQNTIGSFNTATGNSALSRNTTGMDNTANGSGALFTNTTGSLNTAMGSGALSFNTHGGFNTATGVDALLLNTTGDSNTASGVQALYSNKTGDRNTATGDSALLFNDSGSQNTAVGEGALVSSTGDNNTALGDNAGNAVITASNVTCIGANVLGANVSNTTWIGNVYGVATQNAMTAPVIVSADGQLGTVVSSERFKKDIATMEKTSEAILSLRPVTFHYKTDTKGTPHFGLIAEEVAKVYPALVLPYKEGKQYTVRYDAVNAMLMNEFFKENRKVEKQETTISQLKSTLAQQQKDFQATVAQLTARLDEQASQIQKVSAQLAAASPSGRGIEVNRQAPQMVSSNQ